MAHSSNALLSGTTCSKCRPACQILNLVDTTCSVQLLHDHLQVSAWNWTDVSVGDVPAYVIGGWTLVLAFSWPWTTHRSLLQTNNWLAEELSPAQAHLLGTVFLHI